MDPGLVVPMGVWHPAPTSLPIEPAQASSMARSKLRYHGFLVDAARCDGFRVREVGGSGMEAAVWVRFRHRPPQLEVRYRGAFLAASLYWHVIGFPVFAVGWLIDAHKRAELASRVHASLAGKRGPT